MDDKRTITVCAFQRTVTVLAVDVVTRSDLAYFARERDKLTRKLRRGPAKTHAAKVRAIAAAGPIISKSALARQLGISRHAVQYALRQHKRPT